MVDWRGIGEKALALSALGISGTVVYGLGCLIYNIDVKANAKATATEVVKFNNKYLSLQADMKELAVFYRSNTEDGSDEVKMRKSLSEAADLYLDLKAQGAQFSMSAVKNIAEALEDASEQDETMGSLNLATDKIARQAIKHNPLMLLSMIQELDEFYDSDNDNAMDFANAVDDTIAFCSRRKCNLADIGNDLEALAENKSIWLNRLKDNNGDITVKAHNWALDEIYPTTAIKLAEQRPSQGINLDNYTPITIDMYLADKEKYDSNKVRIAAAPISQLVIPRENCDAYIVSLEDDRKVINAFYRCLDDLSLITKMKRLIEENKDAILKKRVFVYGKIFDVTPQNTEGIEGMYGLALDAVIFDGEKL